MSAGIVGPSLGYESCSANPEAPPSINQRTTTTTTTTGEPRRDKAMCSLDLLN